MENEKLSVENQNKIKDYDSMQKYGNLTSGIIAAASGAALTIGGVLGGLIINKVAGMPISPGMVAFASLGVSAVLSSAFSYRSFVESKAEILKEKIEDALLSPEDLVQKKISVMDNIEKIRVNQAIKSAKNKDATDALLDFITPEGAPVRNFNPRRLNF